MLTVKLRNERTKRTRNVECVEVIVEPGSGAATVWIEKPDGTTENVVVNRMNGSDDPAEFHIAFVENAEGSTIQVVRP
jgi:hypothetical protein